MYIGMDFHIHIYDLLKGIGSHDYEVWQVPRCAGESSSWAWHPGEPMTYFSPESEGLRARKAHVCFHSEGCKHKARESRCSLWVERQEKSWHLSHKLSSKMNSLLLREKSVFLFHLVIGLLGGGSPIWGRDISFTQFRFKC